MFKPQDWDTTQARGDGERERITPGGHICIIKGARVDTIQTRNGMSEQFVLQLDVQENGEHDGIFQREYESRKAQAADAKWPNAGLYRQFTQAKDGGTNPYFKGLIKAIEDSNNFTWNFDERELRGKRIGIIYREEEFLDMQGAVRTTVKPAWARSVATIERGVEAPEIKRLAGNAIPPVSAFTPAEEEDLPF